MTSVRVDYKDAKKVFFDLFRQVAGSIAILFDPLSIIALGTLLGVSGPQFNQTNRVAIEPPSFRFGDSQQIARILSAFFITSFRDFLLAYERCYEPQLRVNEKLAHRTWANDCKRVMSTSLRRNICSLQLPGSLLSVVKRSQVEQCIRPELQDRKSVV